MGHLPPEKTPIITLGEWFETPAGQYVRDWEQQRLDALTADIFGYNALQIGLPQIDALRENRMPHRWLSDMRLPVAEDGCGSRRPLSLSHDYHDLPFASHSLDLVVLPHVLEFAAEPHQILREVARVLIPEGQVIICCFNPASLWGLRQSFGRIAGAHFLPVNGEFIGLRRIKDWLKLLSLEVNRGHFGCYRPPCASAAALGRYAFMERAGDRWWPSLGGVYILQAVKRVRGMTLIGPAWNRKKQPQGANVPVVGKTRLEKHGQG